MNRAAATAGRGPQYSWQYVWYAHRQLEMNAWLRRVQKAGR